LESQDTSLKSPKDVEEHVNLPVLAAIPSIHPNGKRRSRSNSREAERSYAGRLLSQLEAGSHIYEAYRALQIKFAMVNGSTVLKSILVTSPNAAEGKTLTAINMAHAFAKNGIKTLLVDCDLRRPMIHHILSLNQEPGLSDVLRNNIVSVEKVAASWAIQAPENENLFVFPCGTLPPNPYELLAAPRMRDVLAEFKRQYDLVILDSPPLMAVTDSIVLGSEVDGVCLVIKSGRTLQDVALRAKRLLENSQTNIIGTILNDIDTKAVNEYDKSHHYVR
jgi:capsular exopolysaccharide synthesis family protein